MIKNVGRSSCKDPLFLFQCNETRFSGQIFEKYSISNFMQILPVEAELFHSDRRTDIKKLTVNLMYTGPCIIVIVEE